MKKSPNIVFIMADQLAASFVGCYGSGVNSTPNLDGLAKDGILFSRNYAATPVCAPNRACILTGRSPEIHGVVKNNHVLQSDNPTFLNVLKHKGYSCGGFGKFHQTPMPFAPPLDLGYLGFDETVVSEDPVWGEYIDWVKSEHPESLEKALSVTNCHSGTVRPDYNTEMKQGASEEDWQIKKENFEKYLGKRISESSWERMYVSPLDKDADDSSFITENGLDFMRKHKDRKSPFFCQFSYVGPHDPYDPPEAYASMFDPEDMKEPIPPGWKNEPGTEFLDNIRDNYLNFRRICDNKEEILKLRAYYHGAIRMIDDCIGDIIYFLKNEGLWENSIVIFTTDHGDSMGDQGLIAKGIHHYDTCIRTPLIISGGAAKERGYTDRLTVSTDIFRTVCEIAGVCGEEMPPTEGKSFAGEILDGHETHYHEAVISTIDGASTIISDDGFRLTIYYGREYGQLFDLKNDPTEQNNLYKNSAYEKKKIELLELFIKLKAKNTMLTGQYRNMPVLNGEKFCPNNLNEKLPLYCKPKAPWLEDTNNKNLWKSDKGKPD